MPPFALRLMYGERADLFLDSHRVLPCQAINSGFEFSFPTIEATLSDLADETPSARARLTDAKKGEGQNALDRHERQGSTGV